MKDGHHARNPGQQWRTEFDGRGFLTCPDGSDWRWGLELRRYGFAGHELGAAGPPVVTTDGQRMAYDWNEHLQEWFINDARGLEHGFTLRQRPSRAGVPDAALLHFYLTVRGGLRAEVQRNGLDVNFRDEHGAIVLQYGGLTVLDAKGDRLSAHFETRAEELVLVMDERTARYPLTIDPIAQQAFLKADWPSATDEFGWAVAASDDTVVVGAPGESSNATGVNGDPTDTSAANAGAAYVFVRHGTNWTQQAYLKASNTAEGGFFGGAVAVSGDTVVVGANGESSNATGINGNQNDNSAPFAGAAYVFVRSGTNWSQQAYLKASNTEESDIFGYAVAMSGDTVAVAAFGEDSQATGINGDQSDNSASRSGAAYVFVRSGTNWTQQAYLKASNSEAFDSFGTSIAVAGDALVVGAPFESGGMAGVNVNEYDNNGLNAGAAYIFARSGTNWVQQAYLKASNAEAEDYFGFAVGVSEKAVVVGAPQESSNATTINGNQNDNSALNAGAAYVFARSGTNWMQQAYLKASNAQAIDQFGWSVAVAENLAVVGAWQESSGTAGSGAAYFFARSGTDWSERAFLKAANAGPADQFGWSVAVSGVTAVVGAKAEDSAASPDDNNAMESGAGYIFTFNSRLAIEPDGEGGNFIRFDGLPGRTYRLQRATRPAGPWVDGSSKVAPASGQLEYHDIFPVPGGAFYRSVQP